MRHWAISIGINQYQFFQPLSYAQHDAQAMQRFLVDDVGIPVEQCLLLTETSPPQWGKSTYPDRTTIQGWLDLLVQRYIQPGDVLWCFFSGYGVCQQGQDYLVPIEGNPTAIPATAIPLEAIFRSLRQATTATVLVLLDINRNGSSSHEIVGTHTAHLASITGIPTLLSCQPGQFSRETSALGHGFFTAALLESLRNRHGTTLAAVEQCLSDRLPELSEHHWQPIQQAVAICPEEKRHQPLLQQATSARPAAYASGDRHAAAQSRQQPSVSTTNGTSVAAPKVPLVESTPYRPYAFLANGNGLEPLAPTNGQSFEETERASTASRAHSKPYAVSASYRDSHGSTNGVTQSGGTMPKPHQTNGSIQTNGLPADRPIDRVAQTYENRATPSTSVPTVPQPLSDNPEDANEIPDALFWRPVLLWGGFAVVALILGVLWRNGASFTPKAPATAPQSNATVVRPSPSGTTQGGSRAATLPASLSVNGAIPAIASATAATRTIPPQTIATAQDFGASGANRLNLVGSKPETTKPIPPIQATGTPPITPPSASSALAKANALVATNSEQASPYWYAIQIAEQIKPGQPDYAEATRNIALWSRQIMSIARQRSRQGRYDAAIVAVRLIPEKQPVYLDAKSALLRWCPSLDRQSGVNPVQRRQARTVCRMIG